ncbi:Ephrin type-B receptor 4, partial [Nibea albiflora]
IDRRDRLRSGQGWRMEGQRGPVGPGRASSCGLPLLLLPLLLLSRCRADEEVLMNTKLETSDLRWTNYPADDPEWEEVSGLDDESNSVRTYQICTLDSPSSYWLRTRWIPRRAATTLYVEIRFTMMECSGLNRRHCKETFNLYYYQSDSDEATPSHPAWMENPYTKVSTVAADHLLRYGGEKRFNVKLLRLEQLRGAGLYLAFQSQGTCMALLSVRVFYRKCPPLRRAFASFPETIPHSLVEQGLAGSCSPCDDSVLYRPAQRGLTQRRVIIWGLRPHSRRTAASENSLSLEWNVPVLQNRYQILDYQLRYSPKDGEEAGQWQYVSSRSSSVVLSGLQRALQYQVQVRARSQTGYGSFSMASSFSTLPDGAAHSQLVLTGVLVSMGILLLITVVIVAVYCYR